MVLYYPEQAYEGKKYSSYIFYGLVDAAVNDTSDKPILNGFAYGPENSDHHACGLVAASAVLVSECEDKDSKEEQRG